MASLLLIIIVAIASILTYTFVMSYANKSPEHSKELLCMAKVDAVNMPSNVKVIIPDDPSKPITINPPLRIYVRNIGEVTLRVDIIYVRKPDGTTIATLKPKNITVIKPGELKVIEIPFTLKEYINFIQKLESTKTKYFIITLGSSSGLTTSSTIPSSQLTRVKINIKNVVINITLVVINCTDAHGWWVSTSKVIEAAQNTAKKIQGLKIVEITQSSQLYDLFVHKILPDETNVSNKYVIIVDGHGEILPLPPQYVKDIDNDGLVEIACSEYADDVHKALKQEPWILVTLVGAPLYYLSNKGFKVVNGLLYFNDKIVDAIRIPTTQSDLIGLWYVETDVDGWRAEFQIRKGQDQPEVVVMGRRFTYAILSGVFDSVERGPDWKGLQNGHENRLAINGKSWHNFWGNEKWGGAVALPATNIVDIIEKFFGVDLPDKISAARAVSSNDMVWFNKVSEYLYGSNQSSITTPIVVLHYDDFTVNSLAQLDAGLNRNMPYWLLRYGAASINTSNRILSISPNTIITRRLCGWADFPYGDDSDRKVGYVLDVASSLWYTLTLQNSTGNGKFYVLLGNKSDIIENWMGTELSINNNVVTEVNLVQLRIISLMSTVIVLVIDQEFVGSPYIELPAELNIKINDTNIEVQIGSWSNTINWVAIDAPIANITVNLGFMTNAGISINIKGPIEVYATQWSSNCGKASAVFNIGNGKYIHAGYSPPYNIVKEFGYSWSEVTIDFIAQIGVYYPIYLILEERGLF